MTTLLMSSRHTEDDQALWRAAIGRGWSVARARGIRFPEIDDDEVVIYVEALYAPTIAGMTGRSLLDPDDDWLCRLPREYRNRDIRLTTLGIARKLGSPSFVKPPNDKSFAAQVYDSGASLPLEFDDDMAVLVAEPVQWESEYRCFCLDGRVLTLSPYRELSLKRAITPRQNLNFDRQATLPRKFLLRRKALPQGRSSSMLVELQLKDGRLLKPTRPGDQASMDVTPPLYST